MATGIPHLGVRGWGWDRIFTEWNNIFTMNPWIISKINISIKHMQNCSGSSLHIFIWTKYEKEHILVGIQPSHTIFNNHEVYSSILIRVIFSLIKHPLGPTDSTFSLSIYAFLQCSATNESFKNKNWMTPNCIMRKGWT